MSDSPLLKASGGKKSWRRPPKTALSATAAVQTAFESSQHLLPYFFCTECNILCGVSSIILDGPHAQHPVIFASEKAGLILKEMNVMREGIVRALPEYMRRLQEVRQRMADLEAAVAEQETAVGKRFDAVVRRAEQRRAMLLEELRLHKEEKLRALKGVEEEMVVAVQKTQSAIRSLPQLEEELAQLPYTEPSPALRKPPPPAPPPPPPQPTSSSQCHRAMLLAGYSLDPPGLPSPRTRPKMIAILRKQEQERTTLLQSHSGERGGVWNQKEPEAELAEEEPEPAAGIRVLPPLLSPFVEEVVRSYAETARLVAAILSCSAFVPELEKIDVVFNAQTEVDLAKYGRLCVHQAGFLVPSQANYGGVRYPPPSEAALQACGERRTMPGGILRALATKGDSEPFRNPCHEGLLRVRCTATLEPLGSIQRVFAVEPLSQDPPPAISSINDPDTALLFDVGDGIRCSITHLCFRHGRSDPNLALTSFVLEGSQTGDEGSFVTILDVRDREGLGDQPYKMTVIPVQPPHHIQYPFFRFRMTGPNAGPDPEDSWRLCISGIEFFGNLYP